MAIPSQSLPTIGLPNSTEDPKIRAALSELQSILTGNVDRSNLLDGEVTFAKAATDLRAFLVPAGHILASAAIQTPTGYLKCDGSAISRGAYPSLYSAITIVTIGSTTNGSSSVTGIPSTADMAAGMKVEGAGIPAGTTIATVASGTSITLSANAIATAAGVAIRVLPYGSGDGSTTFNVPTLTGRVPIGAGTAAGAAGATAHYIGQVGGEETHPLSIAEMPSHTHGYTRAVAQAPNQAVPGTGGDFFWTSDSPQTEAAGGGGPHNNMQPYTGVNYFIRHGN